MSEIPFPYDDVRACPSEADLARDLAFPIWRAMATTAVLAVGYCYGLDVVASMPEEFRILALICYTLLGAPLVSRSFRRTSEILEARQAAKAHRRDRADRSLPAHVEEIRGRRER